MELLLVNTAVGNLIRESRTFQIHSVLQTGASKGMKLLDVALEELVKEGRITKQVAALNSIVLAIEVNLVVIAPKSMADRQKLLGTRVPLIVFEKIAVASLFSGGTAGHNV